MAGSPSFLRGEFEYRAAPVAAAQAREQIGDRHLPPVFPPQRSIDIGDERRVLDDPRVYVDPRAANVTAQRASREPCAAVIANAFDLARLSGTEALEAVSKLFGVALGPKSAATRRSAQGIVVLCSSAATR